MKKLHVYVFVKDLEKSSAFYTNLFKTEPNKARDDYVKWDLENPPLNFAISNHGKAGLDHLGIEVENSSELAELYQRADTNAIARDDEGETVCCYKRSEKSWVKDPHGINWELFHSLNDEETFSDKTTGQCCKPQPDQQACC
jgi:catechol 2,3-dioxygenase-like lactoylglutathione lyase family enzyme